jgi:hypothetical protein
MRKVVASVLSLLTISFLLPATPASAADGPALLTACVNAINDPLYTRATLPGLMNIPNTATLETLITNGTIVVWVANGAGEISGSSGSNGNGRDIYCGDSNDNTIQTMDSDSSTRDYFFGGAGNDSVTGSSWASTFYGGPGNDYAFKLDEGSIFYGGPGTDTAGTIVPGSSLIQEDPDTTAPTFTSASSYNFAENSTFVANVVVNESSTITISAGDDQAKFSLVRISETSSALSFVTAPNFEAPTDNGANNTYAFTVRAVDGSANANTQNMTIIVTNVDETSNFVAFSLSSAPIYGTSVQISATINIAAKVQFKVNNVRIPGCLSVATATNSPFTAVCNWKPARRGSLTITATATPLNVGYSASSATPLRVTVATRTTKR